jgi:uncharacterized protein YkvS
MQKKKGKFQNPENGLKVHDVVIQDLGIEENYKYLGLQQLLGVSDKKAREVK